MTDRKLKSEKSTPMHEELSSSSTSSFSSDDDEIDAKVLKPISHYLYDRRECTKQLFKSVKKEKIRMMLPQTLKKINMNELQEWCVSELSGMSKSRILSILNGKPMIDSSDTDSNSDDSGPSLEIISDTEAWITDSDQPDQKDKSLISNKLKSKKNKKHVTNSNSNATKHKSKMKETSNSKPDLTKVKSEKDTENTNNQQGESLLDLLELEMRARAIRALIRKEEDVIPNVESSSKILSTASTSLIQNNPDSNRKELNNKALNETYKVLKESEVFQNLNSSLNDDEDVVLVIKPTPTIELLSSDSENENSRSCTSKSDNKVEQTDVIMNQETESSDKKKIENNEAKDNLNNKSLINDQTDEINYSSKTDVKQDQQFSKLNNEVIDREEKMNKNNSSDILNSNKNNDTPLSDDRLNDYEEVIDLDNYSSDMDDVDNDNNTNNTEKSNNPIENSSLNSAETWATRYYQTDNVQNVIKESKIQSEIRKRFRERQKLSKLSNSYKDSNKKSSTDEKTAELDEIKPMGSVEEYLALKNLPNSHDGSSTSSTNDDSKVNENLTKEVSGLGKKKNDPFINNELIVQHEQSLTASSDNNP